MLTDVGPVEITVPRDRNGSFEPKIVAKRQKRLTGVDEMVWGSNTYRCWSTGQAGRRAARANIHQAMLHQDIQPGSDDLVYLILEHQHRVDLLVVLWLA